MFQKRKKLFHRQKQSSGGEACDFIKKETLAQVFSSEFCEISKNIFFYRTPPMAASVIDHDQTVTSRIDDP